MVKYSKPLFTGRLIKRYKRFLADIVLDNDEEIVAHVPNTGSMLSTRTPGSRVAVSYNPSPKRKLDWTLQLVESNNVWVSVNTITSNAMIENSIQTGNIPSLAGYQSLRREVKYGLNSRIDILLSTDEQLCYVEVKNVTYSEGNVALFPDAVTKRGTKHLNELKQMISQGHRAVILFLVNRVDCLHMSPADKIDLVYAQTLTDAVSHGVEAMAVRFEHSIDGYTFDKEIPVIRP